MAYNVQATRGMQPRCMQCRGHRPTETAMQHAHAWHRSSAPWPFMSMRVRLHKLGTDVVIEVRVHHLSCNTMHRGATQSPRCNRMHRVAAQCDTVHLWCNAARRVAAQLAYMLGTIGMRVLSAVSLPGVPIKRQCFMPRCVLPHVACCASCMLRHVACCATLHAAVTVTRCNLPRPLRHRRGNLCASRTSPTRSRSLCSWACTLLLRRSRSGSLLPQAALY